jgi:hypothetical protein
MKKINSQLLKVIMCTYTSWIILIFCLISENVFASKYSFANDSLVIEKINPTTKETNPKSGNMCFLTLGLDYSNVEVSINGTRKLIGKLTDQEIKDFCSNSYEGENLTYQKGNAGYTVSFAGFESGGETESITTNLKKFAIYYKQVLLKDKNDKVMGTVILGYGYSLDIKIFSKNGKVGAKYSSIASISYSKAKLNGNISLSKYGIPVDKLQVTFPSLSKIDESTLQMGNNMLENAKAMINNAVADNKISPRLTVIGFIPLDGVKESDMYTAILEINDKISEITDTCGTTQQTGTTSPKPSVNKFFLQ